MQSKKLLHAVFDKSKNENLYYSFDSFFLDARAFIKDVKNHSTICTINPARSGMSRRFNFDRYNMLLNICYNGKKSWDPVFVSGCGMDMHWHLKFSTCQLLTTKKEIEKWSLNLASSRGKIL